MLNPSTADETQDDPTIRRCIAYAKAWGYDGLGVTNIFAFRGTDPADMLAALDPVGPENDFWIQDTHARCKLTVAAWGVHGVHRGRNEMVLATLPTLYHLRLTKEGHPCHPLYLPKHLTPSILKGLHGIPKHGRDGEALA